MSAASLSVAGLAQEIPAQEESVKKNTRIWTDDTGQNTLEAELVTVTDTAVTLRRLNGKTIVVLLARLSKLDAEFARNHSTNAGEEPGKTEPKPIKPTTTEPKSDTPEPKPAEPKPTEPKQVEPKPAEPKQVEPKPAEPKQAEPKQAEPKPAEPKQAEPKTTEPMTTEPKPKTAVSKAVPKPDAPNPKMAEPKAIEPKTIEAKTIEAKPAKAVEEKPAVPTEAPVNKASQANSVAKPSPAQPSPARLDRSKDSNASFLLSPKSDAAPVTEISKTVAGLKEMSAKWPAQRDSEMIKVVRQALKSPDFHLRKAALDLLGRHDATKSFEWILKGLDDKAFDVRWTAYNWLTKMRDPRAIKPLCKRLLTQDREQAARALAAHGVTVESHVIPLLEHESTEIKMAACSILAKIGTKECLPSLMELSENSQTIGVRMQARNAIKAINRRLQPQQAKH